MEDLIILARHLGQVLQERGWMLATAESCTGGGIAQVITENAGSSAYFERGFVTYSNAAKMQLLAVPEDLLQRHGAVSEQVAAAMAEGALAHSQAQLALSTTGIAGPGGAQPGKPVGTVCFGWATHAATHTQTLVFDGDRQAVRRQSIVHALQGALRLLNASPDP